MPFSFLSSPPPVSPAAGLVYGTVLIVTPKAAPLPCLLRRSDERGPRRRAAGSPAAQRMRPAPPETQLSQREERGSVLGAFPARLGREAAPAAPPEAGLPHGTSPSGATRGEVSGPLPAQRRRGRAGAPAGGRGRGRPARLPGSLRDQVAAVPASASAGYKRAPERGGKELTAGICRRRRGGEGEAAGNRRVEGKREAAGCGGAKRLTLLSTPQSSTGSPSSVSGSSSEPEEFQLWLSDMETRAAATAERGRAARPLPTAASASPAEQTGTAGSGST